MLNKKQTQEFIELYNDEKTYEEIAEALDMPAGKVKYEARMLQSSEQIRKRRPDYFSNRTAQTKPRRPYVNQTDSRRINTLLSSWRLVQ